MMRFLIIGLLATAALHADELEKITRKREQKIEKLRKDFFKQLEKLNQDTVFKLENLRDAKDRTGRAKDAKEARNAIDQVQSDPYDIDGYQLAAEKRLRASRGFDVREKRERDDLETRLGTFYKAILDDELKDAYKLVDPIMRNSATRDLLMGHLRIIQGHLQMMKLGHRDLGVDTIHFSPGIDAAIVKTKYRTNGQWHKGKDPVYMVRRSGKWYVGDEKEVKKKVNGIR